MRKLGSVFLAVFVTIAGASLVCAQDAASPEKVKLIKELVEVSGGQRQFNDIVTGMMNFQEEQSAELMTDIFKDDKVLTPAQREEALKLLKETNDRIGVKAREFFTKTFDFGKFVDEVFVPLYSKHFTDNELRDLIAFYRTPTGQKMISESKEFMNDTLALVSKSLVPAFSAYMKQVADEEFKNMRRKMPEN